MKPVLLFCIAAMLAAFVISGCHKNDDDGGDSVNQQDRDFAMMASLSNTAEAAVGQLASDRAQNIGVAAFGQKMVLEHTASRQQLKAIANALNLAAPDSLDPAHVALSNELMRLSGVEFDSVYIMNQLTDHQYAITLYKNESDKGKHQLLRQFADDMLPHLQEHLKLADSLAEVLRTP